MREVKRLGPFSVYPGKFYRRVRGMPFFDLWRSPNAVYPWVGHFGIEWRI